MNNEKHNEFLAELQKLLAKHKATIMWGCSDCSDTYGLYDEHMIVEIDWNEVRVCDGNGLSASNIEISED